MEKKIWHGIMRVIDLHHIDSHGNIISEQQDLPNLLHQEGEGYLLRAVFTGGRNSSVIPDSYYLGLDSRQTVSATDIMSDIAGEPTGNGYSRQPVSSSGDFSLNLQQSHYTATSPIVAFRATTGSWGPVNNLFLTTTTDSSGTLISTVTLLSPVTLNFGDAVTMRIGVQLFECSTPA